MDQLANMYELGIYALRFTLFEAPALRSEFRPVLSEPNWRTDDEV